jgi:hypothetical protein
MSTPESFRRLRTPLTLSRANSDRIRARKGQFDHSAIACRPPGEGKPEERIDRRTQAAGAGFYGVIGPVAGRECRQEFELLHRPCLRAEVAKGEGRYKGRNPTMNTEDVRRLQAEGVRPSEIVRRLSIGRASVYRALEPN